MIEDFPYMCSVSIVWKDIRLLKGNAETLKQQNKRAGHHISYVLEITFLF